MRSPSLGKAKVGRSSVRRGEMRWYTFALPDKRRPVLILSRDSVLPRLNEIIVVPVFKVAKPDEDRPYTKYFLNDAAGGRGQR